jgi:hypothetical protein
MKKTIQKIKEGGILEPIFTILFTLLLLTFVIYPFLTEASTIHNLLGLIFAVGIIVFDYYYFKSYFEKQEDIEIKPGETELDYLSQEDLKPKTKKTQKKKTEQHIVHPKINKK